MQDNHPVALATAAILAFASVVPAHAGSVIADGSNIEIKTKGGFEAKTKDGKYSMAIGGRIQLDYNRYDGVINRVEDETGSDIFFRRARLQIDGKAKDWAYKASYNLTDTGSIDVLLVSYEGWNKMAELTFGQQKENFGLENTGSSKWITAIERSMPANAFSVGKNVGVKLHGANDLITYSVGAFKESVDADDNSLDYALTGRLVVRPLNTKDAVVHLGAGFTTRDGEFDALDARLGVRGGEAGTANQIEAQYDEGVADESQAWNLEAAAIFGPYHIMAEYLAGELRAADDEPDIEATGYYLQAGWIVTGERRAYKTSNGSLDKVSPNDKRSGAWEVFARYDNLDVTDTEVSQLVDIDGGKGHSATLGVNWYSGSNIKVALNYIHAKTDSEIGGEDGGDAVALRLQYVF